MYWYCEVRDNITNEEMKINHLESKFHNSFVNSIIRKYIISNPPPDKIEDTIRKYLRNPHDNYNKFRTVLLLKLLMPSNQI